MAIKEAEGKPAGESKEREKEGARGSRDRERGGEGAWERKIERGKIERVGVRERGWGGGGLETERE